MYKRVCILIYTKACQRTCGCVCFVHAQGNAKVSEQTAAVSKKFFTQNPIDIKQKTFISLFKIARYLS